jgi:hypothetical protein
MIRTLRRPSRCRATLVAAAMVGLPLAGCSGDGDLTSSDTKRVSVAGISFEVPASWEEVDPEDLAGDAEANALMGDLAEQSGLSLDQFERMMSELDLLLMSGEGAQQGFVDNIGVLPIPGPMPSDHQLKRGMMRGGGLEVLDISHEQTPLGDVTVVVYELEMPGRLLHDEAIVFETAEGLLSVTVSASDRGTAADMGDQIVDSLAEAS